MSNPILAALYISRMTQFRRWVQVSQTDSTITLVTAQERGPFYTFDFEADTLTAMLKAGIVMRSEQVEVANSRKVYFWGLT